MWVLTLWGWVNRGCATRLSSCHDSTLLRLTAAPGGHTQMFCRLKSGCTAFAMGAMVLVGGGGSRCAAASYQHVLILSIDGLRQADLSDPATAAYLPNITAFRNSAIHYS